LHNGGTRKLGSSYASKSTPRGRITVQIADEQEHVAIDRNLLRRAVKSVLRGAGVRSATISVAIVDDAAITELNWKYLRHRGPADVLSFLLDDCIGIEGTVVEGEVILGAETAARVAPNYGWPAHHELLLYAIHGTLHLVGYDDRTPRQRAEMQQREKEVLEKLGITRR
jgi:probable rRNA maturation factor